MSLVSELFNDIETGKQGDELTILCCIVLCLLDKLHPMILAVNNHRK